MTVLLYVLGLISDRMRLTVSRKARQSAGRPGAATAVFGSRAATVCGLAVFGEARVLFASDCPFDPAKGPGYIRATIDVLESLDLDPEARAKITHRNAERLFGLAPSPRT